MITKEEYEALDRAVRVFERFEKCYADPQFNLMQSALFKLYGVWKDDDFSFPPCAKNAPELPQ